MHKKKIVAYMLAAICLLAQTAAHSAGLGKLSIESALGQPLSAEIEIIATNPTELANLHARLASPEAFQSANLELSSTITSIKFAINKNPNGGLVLKLSSDKPVNDPFLDMLVELDWGNGQMVREYTLLLDPPGMKSGEEQGSNNLPQTPTVAPYHSTAGSSAAQSEAGQSQNRSANVTPAKRTTQAGSSARAASSESIVSGAKKSIPGTIGPVQRGATLTEIAKQTKPEGVRLEQMLVGLYRQNAKAFDGNMNRLKVGQILTVPSQETVAAISETEAVREIHLQAADWQAYRQKLAGEVAAAPKRAEKSTQASGKIAPAVEDKAAPTKTGQDVLTLSKGELPAGENKSANGKSSKQAKSAQPSAAEQKQMAADDALAKQKALKEANDRTAALQKNIQEMQKLVAMKNAALAAAQQKAAAPAPAAAIPLAVPAAVQPAPAAAPTVAVVPPAAAKAKPVHPVVITPVAPVVEPAWYENINPLYAGAAAVSLLTIALLMFMSKSRRRREGLSKFENSILTSVAAKPNTVYGGEQSGASVNTNNTSFLTDFSQSGLGTLDTHDVDPIAEAEVYMAYGRDAQAEEILKEAMNKDPERQEIKLKLLEIYAARNNLPAFEGIATELYTALAGEQSPIWEKAAELGRKLDPKNPLYGGQATAVPIYEDASIAAAIMAKNRADDVFPAAEMPVAMTTSEALGENPATADADHHLDFPAGMNFDIEMTSVHGNAVHAVEDHQVDNGETAGLDDIILFASESPVEAHEVMLEKPAESVVPADIVAAEHHYNDLSFDFDLNEVEAAGEKPVVTEAEPIIVPSDNTRLLDFTGIDLDTPAPVTEQSSLSEAEQEIKTKFELAQVYQEMGDFENAREILQEVIVEGNADQQSSAQALLLQLG